MHVVFVSSRKIPKVITSITPLQLSIRKKRVLIDFGLSPGLSKMKPENTITRFKNLTLSNLEECDSVSKISSVIRFPWANRSSTTKSLRKLKKSKESRILDTKEQKIRFNAEFAGLLRRTLIIHWSLLANAKVQLDWSTFNAWRIGFSLKSRRNHQMLKTKTSDLSIGSVSNARYASTCIHTPSKYSAQYTKLLTCRSKWTMTTTIFCLSRCR